LLVAGTSAYAADVPAIVQECRSAVSELAGEVSHGIQAEHRRGKAFLGEKWDDNEWLSELMIKTAAQLPAPKRKAGKKKG